MNNNRKKKTQTQTPGEERLKSFLDMIAPSVIQFTRIIISAGIRSAVSGHSGNIRLQRMSRQSCAILGKRMA